jgi:hypothetical protein
MTQTPYEKQQIIEQIRLQDQENSGYLSKRKIKNMTSDELILNQKLVEVEIESRGLGMLFD